MTDTLESASRLRKLRWTPMRDLLRGRITGRLDWRDRLRQSGLAPQIQQLIQYVVRRTRLPSFEKVAVTDELIAHFCDGIEAAASPSDLMNSFGNPRQTARLIRRAKLRARSVPARIWHGIRRTLGWCLVLYILLAIRFFIGRPHPDTNYLAMLNAPILQSVPIERAWPIYRQAILQLSDRSNESPWPELLYFNNYGPKWRLEADWIKAHQPGIELVRQAATKPVLGFILGDGGSQYDPELGWHFGESHPGGHPSSALDGWLYGVLLPYLAEMRHLAIVLEGDAKLAAEQHDAARALADVNALLSMVDQLHREKIAVVSDMVAIGIHGVDVYVADCLLRDHPDLWTDEQLTQLAHRLALFQTAADLIDPQPAEWELEDVLQRVFTDNGHGDGRLTPRGITAYRETTDLADQPALSPELFALISPAIASVSMSRAQQADICKRYIEGYQRTFHQPLREVEASNLAAEKEVDTLKSSPLASIRLFPTVRMLPSLDRAATVAERALGKADGLTTAIALEIYHRHHGQYPATLAALTPQLLPSVPPDRITGEPMHYRLQNGKPVLYSVGADRHDDGGVQLDPHDNNFSTAVWNVSPITAHKGDWILYPEPVISDRE